MSYRPRPTLSALARQYRDYGRWRRVVARTHRDAINARYLAPPAVLVVVASGAVLGFLWPVAWMAPVGYFAVTTIGGLTLSSDLTRRERAMFPLILPIMHLSWGWGFLTSRVRIG